MLSLSESGLGKILSDERGIAARGAEIVRKYQDFASDEGVFDELFACLRRNLNAKRSIRVDKPTDADTRGAYGYEVIEDGMTQIASARVLAQILRLLPQANGTVTVNTSNQTLTITPAADTVAELASLGVTREQLAGACQELLTAVDGDRVKPADPVSQ